MGFNEINGLSVVFCWWSMIGDSMLSEQKMIPVSPCRSSFEADLALWCVFGVDDDDDYDGRIRFSDQDRESNLGAEKEGSVTDRGASIFRCWDREVFSVRVEVAWFVLGAVVVIFQVVAGFVVEIEFDFFLQVFISHSLFVSPLSLLLFRFVVVSIPQAVPPVGAAFSFSPFSLMLVKLPFLFWVCFLFFGFLLLVLLWYQMIFFGDAIVTVVVFNGLTGDFLFLLPPLWVTWVHPSVCWGGLQFPG